MSDVDCVIVGAGLGGLCAAAGLVEMGGAGLRVVTLERDDALGSRPQGYRININASGAAALRKCLPRRHFGLYQDTSHRQVDPSVDVFDTSLSLLLHREADDDGASTPPSAVDRETLRTILADAAGDIRYGEEVVGVEVVGADVVDAAPGDRGVRIRTRRGTELTADMAIVADGAAGKLGAADPVPTGQIAIYGRAPLDPARLTWLPRGVIDQRFVGITDAGATGSAATTLALGAWNPRVVPSKAVASAGLDITLPRDNPYVMWVLISDAARMPDSSSTPRELHEFARRSVRAWPHSARQFVDDAIVDDTFRITLAATPVVPTWPSGPIAYLGDAMHAMSPAGGEGANTAFADAAALVDTFDENTRTWLDRYQEIARRHAAAALRRSQLLSRPDQNGDPTDE